MTYYTKDGEKLTAERAAEITERNTKLFEEAAQSGDFSKLLEIQWLFGEPLEKALKGECKK